MHSVGSLEKLWILALYILISAAPAVEAGEKTFSALCAESGAFCGNASCDGCETSVSCPADCGSRRKGKRRGLFFEDDFESGAIDGDNWKQSGNGSPVAVTTEARSGSYSAEFILNRDDSTSYRTEKSFAQQSETWYAAYGGEYWQGWSIFVPGDYGYDTLPEIVAQFHAYPDGSNGPGETCEPAETWRVPPLAIEIWRGQWHIAQRWDTRPCTPPDQSGTQSRETFVGPVRAGAWTDWVVHVVWYADEQGLLRVWKNGELVVDINGPNTYYDRSGPYSKIGIYKSFWRDKWSMTEHRRIHIDSFRIGTSDASYEDVAP